MVFVLLGRFVLGVHLLDFCGLVLAFTLICLFCQTDFLFSGMLSVIPSIIMYALFYLLI